MPGGKRSLPRRMRPEAQQELDRLLRRERLRRLVPTMAILAVIIGVCGYWFYPETLTAERIVAGEVISWTRPQSYTGAGNALITVTLEDGRKVIASSKSGNAPNTGDGIKLRERSFESGRVEYIWQE